MYATCRAREMRAAVVALCDLGGHDRCIRCANQGRRAGTPKRGCEGKRSRGRRPRGENHRDRLAISVDPTQPAREAGRPVAAAVVARPRGHLSDRSEHRALRVDLAGADRAPDGDGLRADQHRADLAATGAGQPASAGQSDPDGARALADGAGHAPACRARLPRCRAALCRRRAFSRASVGGRQQADQGVHGRPDRLDQASRLPRVALRIRGSRKPRTRRSRARSRSRIIRCTWWRRRIS